MKVNLAFELSDDDRRRLRGALKRGGMATRAEVRVLFSGLVQDYLGKIQNVVIRRRVAKPVPVGVQVESPTPETTCKHCKAPFVAHGGMRQSCPGSLTRRPGMTRFEV